jgi:hypothetical protein
VATIVNNKKYGEGHQVVLKASDKLSSPIRSKFTSKGYAAGKSVFSIVIPNSKTKADKLIELAVGKAQVYLKDNSNKILLIKGSDSSINGSFNHYSDNAKSNTNLLTEIKENVSLWVFESIIENGRQPTEEQIMSKLDNQTSNYSSVYYDSAIKQSIELKKYIKAGNRGYTYERQNQNLTKKMYDTARKLSKKANDNWNPADVWMIKKNYDMTPLYKADNIVQLNETILMAINQQNIIPISLKQVTNNNAGLSLVDPANMKNQKINLDLSLKSIALSETFNNFIIETKSGFAIRGGFKASASTLNVSLEGRFIGAGFQVGAVDAKAYKAYMEETFRYALRGSSGVSETDHVVAHSELEKMFSKYGKLSNKLENYKAAKDAYDMADELTKDRFANIMSYLASFLLVPTGNDGFEKNMKHCYFLSKKITSDSCAYVIIQ